MWKLISFVINNEIVCNSFSIWFKHTVLKKRYNIEVKKVGSGTRLPGFQSSCTTYQLVLCDLKHVIYPFGTSFPLIKNRAKLVLHYTIMVGIAKELIYASCLEKSHDTE